MQTRLESSERWAVIRGRFRLSLLAIACALGISVGYSSCQLRAINCYALMGEEITHGTRAGQLSNFYLALKPRYGEEELVLGPAPETPNDARGLLDRQAFRLWRFGGSMTAPGAWAWLYRPTLAAAVDDAIPFFGMLIVAGLGLRASERLLRAGWSERLQGKRCLENATCEQVERARRSGARAAAAAIVAFAPVCGVLGWYIVFPRSSHGLALSRAILPTAIVGMSITCAVLLVAHCLGLVARRHRICAIVPVRRNVCPACSYPIENRAICPECGPDVLQRGLRRVFRIPTALLRYRSIRVMVWVGLGILTAIGLTLAMADWTRVGSWVGPKLARVDAWTLRSAVTNLPTKDWCLGLRWPLATQGAAGAMVIEWDEGWGVFAQRTLHAPPAGGARVACVVAFCPRTIDPARMDSWTMRAQIVTVHAPWAGHSVEFEFFPGLRALVQTGDISGGRGVAGVWGLPRDSYPLAVWPGHDEVAKQVEQLLVESR